MPLQKHSIDNRAHHSRSSDRLGGNALRRLVMTTIGGTPASALPALAVGDKSA
jgi:hypothetical protein